MSRGLRSSSYKILVNRLSLQRSRIIRLPFHSLAGGIQQMAQLPELYIEKLNGTEEIILEEDLYRYMRHRWLFNEQHELSKHYLHFNLSKLLDTAIDVAGDGAQRCIKVLKCLEGLHNKAFILTMDNGVELFAKLPNPNAGPTRYTTASEVATRYFLREVLHLPAPQVFAWSSDAANPVGAEYIIEEKAPGVRLGSLWNHWPQKRKLDIITQITEIEQLLASVSFPKHGCIYFKEDLLALTGVAADLSINLSVAPEILNQYTLGPLSLPELWNGGRESMELDRGPWRNSSEYTQAMGLNEIAWIKSHATPQMNYYRSISEPELPKDALSLLTQYMNVAPYLVPQDSSEASSAVLWHPDLHLNNVFVDPESYKITSIIDWQSAVVAPLFFQCGVPTMFRHSKPVKDGWAIPERPANFESLSEDEKRQITEDLEGETIHKYYEAQTYKRVPRHWSALQQKTIPFLRKPVWLVSRVWENHDLFFLRQSLISLMIHWDGISPNSVKCPVSFSEEELNLHAKEEENMDGIGQLLTLFRDQGVLPVDGMVEPQDYEMAKENSQKFKDVFIGLAADEEERKLFSKLWPYQDSEA